MFFTPTKGNFNPGGHRSGAILLNNGMYIFGSGCWTILKVPDFMVDINSIKGPNMLGYDVFYFVIDSDNKIYPSPSKSFRSFKNSGSPWDKWGKNTFCDFDTDVNVDNGVSCSYFALSDKNPKDENKSYWESLPNK